jgi:hypothetical protein
MGLGVCLVSAYHQCLAHIVIPVWSDTIQSAQTFLDYASLRQSQLTPLPMNASSAVFRAQVIPPTRATRHSFLGLPNLLRLPNEISFHTTARVTTDKVPHPSRVQCSALSAQPSRMGVAWSFASSWPGHSRHRGLVIRVIVNNLRHVLKICKGFNLGTSTWLF